MRKLLSIAAAGLLVLGVAGNAQAGTFSFTGALEIQISALDPIVIPGGGSATTIGDPHLGALIVSPGAFVGGKFLVVTDPAASPIVAVSAMGTNATGSFTAAGGPGGGFGGPMGIPGAATVCLFTSTCTGGSIVVPFTTGGKGVGLGGTPTPQITAPGAINVSVTGAQWTIGTAAGNSGPIAGPFTTDTRMGFAHGPASGGLSSAAQGSGVVQLVSPIQIGTDIGPSGALPGFAVMTLHFVPEPGTLLLIGSGIAGLALLGRKRMRK